MRNRSDRNLESKDSRSLLILLLLILLLSSQTRTTAQQVGSNSKKQTGSITGRITVQGKPTPGIELALLPESDLNVENAISKTTTDDKGAYRFSNLPSSHYRLKVLSPD